MNYIGKRIRLSRIFRSDNRTVIIAVDHGRRYGAIKGLENFADKIEKLVKADIDALMMTPSMIEKIYENISGKVSLIARIDGTGGIYSSDETDDRLISSVKRAVCLGADAVSVMVYPGSERENILWEKLAIVSEEAFEYGIPVLAEAIPKPPGFQDKYTKNALTYSARIAVELGADIVKIPYTGDIKSFEEVVNVVPAPIVVLGGPKKGNIEDFLKTIWEAVKAGAKGVAIGRNVFQYENPTKMANILSLIVHKGKNYREIISEL
ncbi:MAG: hypothetical protein J7K23_01890 [Thermoproteales archaeon]|nr:hypothetical protein [Thermoproteales archaeon]